MSKAPRPAVLLVHPVRLSGEPNEAFKAAVRELGFAVGAVYQCTADSVADIHALERDDDFSVYATERDDAVRQLPTEDFDIRAVVPVTESGVYLTDMIAERLGVPGNDPELAWARRSKSAMRARAVETGVRVPGFRLVHTASEIREAVAAIGFPAIVKPTLGAGSHGVTLVSDADALDRVDQLPTHDIHGLPIREWLVERYVRGPEFAVNFFSFDGEHRLLDIWEYRRPGDGDYDFPLWDIVQIDERHRDWERVSSFVREVLDAYGIERGASHTEVKCNDEGVFLVEIAARWPGGPALALWEKYGGLRPLHDTVNAFLGRRPALFDRPARFAKVFGSVVVLNEGAPGRLVAMHGLEDVERLPDTEELLVGYRPGEHVPHTRDATAIPFSVAVHGPDEAALLETMAIVRSLVRLEIEPAADPADAARPA